jgi:hypothetical protein
VATGEDRQSAPPVAPLLFRHRCPWGNFAPPDPADVAEEARWLAEPPVAIVAAVPWRGGPGRGLIVSADRVHGGDADLIQEWLGAVDRSQPMVVPSALRVRFGSFRALAVPMRTPGLTVGAIALPLRPGWGPIARELENLGSDFALRFEAADRRAQITLLRVASVGSRPTGRRDAHAKVLRAPPRSLAAGGAPHWRALGFHGPSARRVEPDSGAIGRDGSLALGRR